MRYQIKYVDSLQIIYDKDPSWEELAIHFSMYGYDPLYVYKNGKINYVITFQDFSMRKINTSLNRQFIKEYTDTLQNSDIEKAFLADLDAERIIYLRNGKVVCEANALIELALQNSIAKNLMALRYVKIFHQELSEYLEKYDSILILAEYDVYSYLQNIFDDKNMLYAENVNQAIAISKEQHIDICLDFLYTKKFRMILAPQMSNVVDLCKILTSAALHRLVDLARKRNVSLFFYKLPRFQDLSCLHEREEENFHNRKTIGQLINDNSYLDLFTEEKKNKLYLRKKEFHASQRLDNGYCFVMDEASGNNLNVHNGIRNSGYNECEGSIANFFGPCTTYGLFVEDALTVPGMVQQYAVKEGKSILIHNRAGIHGDNELNSIMEALMVPVASGDIHIFLDVLEDLLYDDYPQISFVRDWFNAEKSIKEVQFLDFPGHCNAKANKIMAQHIFEDLANEDICEKKEADIRKPLLTEPFDSLENIAITNVSFIKQRRIIGKYFVNKNKKGTIAVLVITGKEKLQLGKKFVEKCLLQCDFLYVLFVNANVKSIGDNKLLYDYICSLDSEKVIGIPLEYFFYVDRYFDTGNNAGECKEQLLFVQRALFKLICDELYANTYFYHDSDEVYYQNILERASNEQRNLRLIKV